MQLSLALALLTASAAHGLILPRAGTQFITGVCKSDKDCASDCCGFRTGKCAGPVIAQERDGGCGFGENQSNDRAAVALGFAHRPPVSTQPFNPGNNNGGNGGAAGNPATPPPANTGSGKAPGTQFITGQCANDGECASACCGFRTGKCAGAIVAQERDGGCGFGDAQPNDRAARALGFKGPSPAQGNGGGAASPAPTTPANNGSGKAPGTQFITGQCANDGECASACCGFRTGKCAGAIVAQERDGGCGFGDAQPNDRAARALGFKGPSPAQGNGNGGAASTPAPTTGSGKAPGTQFITGACANDGECASACCGFRTGKCAGPIVAQERDGGCGFGDAQPNDRAAKALRGRADPERKLL